MEQINRIIEDISKQYSKSPYIVAIFLIGSVARGTADEFSDVDLYVITDKPGEFSRDQFMHSSTKIEVLFDTLSDALHFLKTEEHSLYRNVTCMLAEGRILFSARGQAEHLQKIAKKNLKLKTTADKNLVLMHRYSIDDFLSDSRRDAKNGQLLSFYLNANKLIQQAIELVLMLHGDYMRQPRYLVNVLSTADKQFMVLLNNFAAETVLDKRLECLEKIAKHALKISGGPMPEAWHI